MDKNDFNTWMTKVTAQPWDRTKLVSELEATLKAEGTHARVHVGKHGILLVGQDPTSVAACKLLLE